MRFYNKSQRDMARWCKANPGVAVEITRLESGIVFDEISGLLWVVKGAMGYVSSSLEEPYADVPEDWQVAEWSPVKPELKDCFIVTRDVRSYRDVINCGYFAIDNPEDETIIIRPVVTYEDWRVGLIIPQSQEIKPVLDNPGIRIDDKSYDLMSYIRTQEEKDKLMAPPPSVATMTRDEAHESDMFMEWVRANRDKVGLKAVWQTKAEAEQALIEEVRGGKE